MAMTIDDLTRYALPYVRNSVHHAKPIVRQRVGAVWLLIGPAWWAITGPFLNLSTKISIEIAIGLSSERAIPILRGIIGFVNGFGEEHFPNLHKKFLEDLLILMETPHEQMTEPSRRTLAGEYCGQADCAAFRR